MSDDRITGFRQPRFGLASAEQQTGIINTPPASEPLAPLAEETARSVFLAWEKLRVAFNAALVFVVLLSAGVAFADRPFWRVLVQGALLANLCFCLGPVAEGYLVLIGLDRRAVRWGIFTLGALAGCFLTFATVFLWHLRWY